MTSTPPTSARTTLALARNRSDGNPWSSSGTHASASHLTAGLENKVPVRQAPDMAQAEAKQTAPRAV